MLADRDSNPIIDEVGNLHTYNNPLFRESVRLGAYANPSNASWSHRARLDDGGAAAEVAPWIRIILDQAKSKHLQVLADACKTDALKLRKQAPAIRKCGLRVSAADMVG